MDNVALLQQVVDETTKVVDNVTPDQLGNATPCTDWTVRDILNHITGGATMFAISAEQGAVPDDVLATLIGGDNIGADPQGAWAVAAARAMAAFEAPGVLDKIVKLPFGEMPAGVALNIAVFDVLTHAADIARATGQTLDETDLVETALTMGRQMIGPELRQPGIFDDEQPAGADAAPVDRLLAFAGRRV
ncbi:MAG: TIGR03086 family protein [Actinobacteria bacterium]|nr:TIGR03086 family protein [Actinomycetota bacterium]